MKSKTETKMDDTLVQRVRTALAEVRGVKEKKMFGSIAFMVRDKMCVAARPERIMCRIAPELHDEAVKRDGCETVVMKGRVYRGYVYVAAEAVKTARALQYWIDRALEQNETLTKAERA